MIAGTKAQTQEGINAQLEFLITDQRDNLKCEYGLNFIQSITATLTGAKALAGQISIPSQSLKVYEKAFATMISPLLFEITTNENSQQIGWEG